jgi:sugar lactone lactonase YvrE
MTRRRNAAALGAMAIATGAAVIAPLAIAHNRAPYGPPYGGALTSYALPASGVYPEGVAFERDTRRFFVTSATTGAVFRGKLNDPTVKEFLPAGSDGRTNAVGVKTDDDGHLFVAGGGTGKVWIYDSNSGALLFTFDNQKAGSTFLNDLAIDPSGDVYVTDSSAATLWKIPSEAYVTGAPTTALMAAVPLGAPYVQEPGFNANGIVASRNGKYVLFVQSTTGKLFRVAIAGGTVTEVGLKGGTLANGDGLALRGHELYAIRNSDKLLVRIHLGGRFARGRIISERTDPSFMFPTTLALAGRRALVVNSQFDKGGPAGPGTPQLPFTVSSVKLRGR